MKSELIDRILYNVQSIPPFPAAVERLCELASDPESDLDEIMIAISTDDVLTSRILRAVNSSLYGPEQKITTVSEAVVMLGMQAVRNLALGVSIFSARMRKEKQDSFKREDLWRHSLAVALGAREVARFLGDANPEETFTAGLLHDLGQVVFREFFYDLYAPVLEEAAKGARPLHQLEQEAFGINHAEVGRELCKHWKIPESLTQVVADHHRDIREEHLGSREDRRVFAIQVADNLARIAQIGSDGDANVETEFLRILDTEEIPPERLHELLLVLPEEVHNAEVFFHMVGSENVEVSHEASHVGVFVEDRKEREVIRLLLLNLGYNLITAEELRKGEIKGTAIIIDATSPPDLCEWAKTQNVPMLDFAKWRTEAANQGNAGQINVVQLKDWLKSSLGR